MHGHMPVLLKVREGAAGRVNRQMREVGRTQAFQLGVEIGEIAALKQRIVGEVDAGDDILRAEGDLFGRGEEIVHQPVEDQAADDPHRHQLLRDDLGRVEHVEVEIVGEFLIENLDPQLPLGEIAGVDGVPQVAAVEIGVGAVQFDRLVPDHRLETELGLPVEFDIGGLAVGIDQTEGVDAKALHHAEGTGNRPVGHDPHDHVHAFRAEADEVPEIVMGGLRLRKAAIGRGLGGVDQVRKFDCVLDEEDRDIITDNVPIAFLGVELDGKTAHVARDVGRPLGPRDGGEAHKGLGLFADALENVGARDVGQALGQFEIAMRAIAAGVDDALGNPLMVEMKDFFAEVEILQQRRAARTLFQAVLVVSDRHALRCRQNCAAILRGLVRFAALTLFFLEAVRQIGRGILPLFASRGCIAACVRRHGNRSPVGRHDPATTNHPR